MKIAIYGAQGIALGTYRAICTLHPEISLLCFVVTSIGINQQKLDGVPVKTLADLSKELSENEKKDIQVLIATPENVMDDIEKCLESEKFYNHIRVTSERWSKMQEMAFLKNGEFEPLPTYPICITKPELNIFKMVHHKDCILNSVYTEPDYFTRLQVGAICSDKYISEFHDDTGDNISAKNSNYSELTGLYWVWKNVLPEANPRSYYGLAHYRRSLVLTEDDILRLSDNDIDVVLPYPLPYEPDIEEHHKRYLSDDEWNGVIQALAVLEPEYLEAFEKKISKQDYMYNYNMIIAKADVLDAYCEWLFNLLFRIEKINDPDSIKMPNRYLGYVAETLETLYFMYNKNKLTITHSAYRFLI